MALVDGLSHMVVQVSDLDVSEAFYRDVFGLDVIGRDLVANEGPNSLLATNTRQRIVLVQVPEVPPYPAQGGSIHHAWLLTNEQFNAAEIRLKEMGFDSAIDPRRGFRARGERNMDVIDPDGNRYQVQTHSPEATEIIMSGEGKVDCGNVDDFAMGSVTQFTKARFFLVRSEDGFLAMSRWCTHINGQVVWQQENWHFYCPFHGAKFDRRGEYVGNMGCKPLRLHPVTITADGAVIVDTDQVFERQGFEPSQAVPATCGAANGHGDLERVG